MIPTPVSAQISVLIQMAVIRIGESAMPWMFRSCGSFQESNFTTLQPPTSLLTLIRSGATLAATLDLVSRDLIRLYSRLRVVPHFSSGIVEKAKRECAWKSTHARKGDTQQFATKIFSATQRCNILATLFQMATTLFQNCNAVLR